MVTRQEVRDAVAKILNLSIGRGYHPVTTIDETDKSLEIEARLDPYRLLLLQVWPSGAADGRISSDMEGAELVLTGMVTGVADWLVSSEAEIPNLSALTVSTKPFKSSKWR